MAEQAERVDAALVYPHGIRAMNRQVKVGFALFAIAAIPRLLGAFFLPNTFGDAYVYIRDIGSLSTKIKGGTFAITDLYGFWLPLYQFISADVNVFVGNGFYVGKVVSALFGVGVCLLVYAITLRLVAHKLAALLAFLLIALNPLHILNSTSAMTDVPHAFFVLGCLYFVLKRNWIVAAIFAALAGLTRVESWMLIALIPALQVLRERRVSISPMLIMLIPPLFWFWVSWKATGDWLACFKMRQQYHDWLLAQNPALAHFSVVGVAKDLAMFLSGTDIAVLIAAFAAGAFLAQQTVKQSRHRTPNTEPVLAALVFFFAFFILLLFAYVTHQQPIIFPRYGLILFSLGIPILAWTYFAIVRRRPESARDLFVTIALLCVLNASAQFTGAIGELNRYSAQRRVADYLRAHFDANSNGKIFCDEGTVRALSGIADDRFVTSSEVLKDYDGFLAALAEKKVEWTIIAPQPGSTPARLFPWVEYGEPIGPYEAVMEARSEFLPTNIHVYRRNTP
ncbi:MAG TPA: phospholipid carrier-dependent glycosyltransferase [Pyrinomonadaceae bacterium]|nr:phospholipid carrier-dependent glycosyltransferase [Pyrinomonadaceae bacterium]